jgi:hypothetical protein
MEVSEEQARLALIATRHLNHTSTQFFTLLYSKYSICLFYIETTNILRSIRKKATTFYAVTEHRFCIMVMAIQAKGAGGSFETTGKFLSSLCGS